MNPLSWSFRRGFSIAALLCGALLAYGYYAQFHLGFEPCPLCIFQRVALIAVAIVCAAAALHNPAGVGRRVYGALTLVAAGAGIGIAARHVWLQHLPPDAVPECGPGLDYMLEAFPLGKALRMAFTGSGECAKVDWTFAGLSMPEWTLLWFAGFALGALYYGFRRYAR